MSNALEMNPLNINDNTITIESLYEQYIRDVYQVKDMDYTQLQKDVSSRFKRTTNKFKSSLWLELFKTDYQDDLKFVEDLQLSDEYWEILSIDAIPSITFARKFKDKINWDKLYYNDDYSEFMLSNTNVEFKSHDKAPYSLEFIEEFAPYINFEIAYNFKKNVKNDVIKKYTYDQLMKQKLFHVARYLTYNYDGQYDLD